MDGTELITNVKSYSVKKGFTLIELIIAVSLMSMVIACIVAVDLASRKFLTTSNYESRVQNEVSPVLDRIAKNVTQSYGNDACPGVNLTTLSPLEERLAIRRLDSAFTYDNFADDTWIAYQFNDTFHEIRKYSCSGAGVSPCYNCSSWGSPEVIAANILSCDFNVAPDTGLYTKNANLWVNVTITALINASLPESQTNPQVRLNTTIALRSQSIN